MISSSKLFNFQIKAPICKHLEIAVFFMSILLLNLCYELRKRNHVPSALQTQARTQIDLRLALRKLQKWTLISARDIGSKLLWQKISYLTELIFSCECFPEKESTFMCKKNALLYFFLPQF